jgi:hypothetical protein
MKGEQASAEHLKAGAANVLMRAGDREVRRPVLPPLAAVSA